jgi:hypothetical protein
MTAVYDVCRHRQRHRRRDRPGDDAFLAREAPGEGRDAAGRRGAQRRPLRRMGAAIEASGGSAGNTIAGVASFGGKAAYLGKVADDQLGDVFAHDMTAHRRPLRHPAPDRLGHRGVA